MQWTPPLWSRHSARLRIALCCLFALYCVMSMRASLGMAMVCMVNSTAFAKEEYADLISHAGGNLSAILEEPLEDDDDDDELSCPTHVNEKTITKKGYDGHLLWSPRMQTLVFSANYFGAISTILLSGPLADKFGPKRNLMTAVSVMVCVTLLTPLIASHSYVAFYISRVFLGMAEAFIVPSINSLVGHWFPATEKSSMAALYTSGNQLAVGSSGLVGSQMCRWSFLGGWPSIYYVFGSISILWLALFYFFATDYPAENRFIRSEEKEYLEGRVPQKKGRLSVPWRKMLSSPQLYTCLFCHFSNSFCVTIMQNYLPIYFKDELFLPLKSNGMYTVAPFLTQLLMKNVFATISDNLKRRKLISATSAVRLFQAINSFGSAASLVCLAVFPNCHRPWVAAVFLLSYGAFFACGISGFFTALLSIAPAYSGTVTSFSVAFGHIASIFATNLVSLIVYMGWPHKWLIVFCVAAVLQIVACTVFQFLGSAEVQSWAAVEERPAKLSMLEDSFNVAGFTDDDELSPAGRRTLSCQSVSDVDARRKSSREAALVTWTLSSGNDVPIIEEEDEHEDIYVNGVKVT